MNILLNATTYFIISGVLLLCSLFIMWRLKEFQKQSNMQQALITNVTKTKKQISKKHSPFTIYIYDVELFRRGCKCSTKVESSLKYEIGDYIHYKIVNKKLMFDNADEDYENVIVSKRRWPCNIIFFISIFSLLFGLVLSKIQSQTEFVYFDNILFTTCCIFTGMMLFGFLIMTLLKPKRLFNKKMKHNTIVRINGEVIGFKEEMYDGYVGSANTKYKMLVQYKDFDGNIHIEKNNFIVRRDHPYSIGDTIDVYYDKSTNKIFPIEGVKNTSVKIGYLPVIIFLAIDFLILVIRTFS